MSNDVTIRSTDQYVDFYAKVMGVVYDAIATGDFEPAFDLVLQLNNISHASGIMSALALTKLWDAWRKSRNGTESELLEAYENEASARTGLTRLTIRRYIMVGRMHESGEIPKDLEYQVMALPMNAQIRLAYRWNSGSESFSDPKYAEKLREIIACGGRQSDVTRIIGKPQPPRVWRIVEDDILFNDQVVAHIAPEASEEAREALSKRLMGSGLWV